MPPRVGDSAVGAGSAADAAGEEEGRPVLACTLEQCLEKLAAADTQNAIEKERAEAASLESAALERRVVEARASELEATLRAAELNGKAMEKYGGRLILLEDDGDCLPPLLPPPVSFPWSFSFQTIFR